MIKSRRSFILIGMVSLLFLIGITEVIKDYHLEIITGSAISGEFEIEEIKEAKSPKLAVLLGTEDHKLREDSLGQIVERDENSVILKQTTIPAKEEDNYLFMEWNNKLTLLSLYMKKDGEDTAFEIWGPGNTKIASGELTNEYKWYHFEVSSNKMSSKSYAIFNYGGGSANIYIDKILGIESPESGLAKLTGMMIGTIY